MMGGHETPTAASATADRVGVGVSGAAMEVAARRGAPGIPPAPCDPTAAEPGSPTTAGQPDSSPTAVGHRGAAGLIGGAGDVASAGWAAATTFPADTPGAGDREVCGAGRNGGNVDGTGPGIGPGCGRNRRNVATGGN